MHANNLIRTGCAVSLLSVLPVMLNAQIQRSSDLVVFKHWAAPLYWQPQSVQPAVSLPASVNLLVFVAMTPCRVVDTRASQGFQGAFGPPSLAAGVSRTFPLQSSTTCAIPAAAQAYSLNVAVVPSSNAGFLTAYPTGMALPLASTLDWSQGLITSNAAIVPGGTNGAIDMYANSPTDVVIDINGYYASVTDLLANTALGTSALSSNTTGHDNTAFGNYALMSNTTGDDNTAVGLFALGSNTSGRLNTAIGDHALNYNTADANTATGFGTLALNTTGNQNTADGVFALSQNTTGNNNVAIGDNAIGLNTTGNQNVAIGNEAVGTTSGSKNIGIGFQAGINVSGASSNNIHIGNSGNSADNNTIRIGTPGTQTAFFAAGVRGVTTGKNDAIPVVIDSNGQLGTVSSSRRFKEDIQDMGKVSQQLLRLRPVTFRYQRSFDDGSKPIQYGLIAEEVADVFPELVARSADGQIETVKYQVLDSMLLNEVQRQEKEIRELKERIARLESDGQGTSHQ
jgi:hypothetical protein